MSRSPARFSRSPIPHVATVLAAVLAFLLPAACSDAPVSRSELAAYRDAAGNVSRFEISAPTARGRYAKHRIRLTGSSGLLATGWLLRPPTETGCNPAVLLQDGREENAGVIERLPADFGDVLVLSLDYPAAMPMAIQLADVVQRGEEIERAARQIPSLFLLGVSYLASRADVDSTRIALAATSFAVPFASIAAAADGRIANVALIYGAGDLPGVLAANLRVKPTALRGPLAWLAMRRFSEFAPERFVGGIAPRPLVMVNGLDDPQMPRAAVERLHAAAREPKELVWMRTGHLMPTDSALIRSLVDTAMARLPVLHDSTATRRCAGRRPASRG